MIVNTQRLFTRLLAQLQITDVLDVGSMNGAEALSFRAVVPSARIHAFEPNPHNFALMRTDRRLQQADIRLLPWAVSDRDGESAFFLVAADYARCDPRRGMSSLHRRGGAWPSDARICVTTTRLDSFFAAHCSPAARLALWVDAEGMAYEVIEGLSCVAARVQLLHVEVETQLCIGTQQRLYPEVRQLLRHCGLTELATDQPPWQVQFNALFVRSDLGRGTQLRVRAALFAERLRYLAVQSCGRLRRGWRSLRPLPSDAG